MCLDAKLDTLPPMLRWPTHKMIIRAAAKIANHVFLTDHPNDPLAINFFYSSIARAVARNDLVLARQWYEQGQINEVFQLKAQKDLDKHRGADARAIGGPTLATSALGPAALPRWQEQRGGQAASAYGRVQSGRHRDFRAASSATAPAPAASSHDLSGSAMAAGSPGLIKCAQCNEPLGHHYRVCPVCAQPAHRTPGPQMAPDEPMFYRPESVASGGSQASRMSVADQLRAARRAEKGKQEAVRACMTRLMTIWLGQHMASAGARMDSFTNGMVAERQAGVAERNAKERSNMAAVARPDKEPPEHWVFWDDGLTATEEIGLVRPEGLTDQMVAVIDKATEPTHTGFHGPSRRLALTPRSEATVQAFDGPCPRVASGQVLAILAEIKGPKVTAVAEDTISTAMEHEVARAQAFESIMADPPFNEWWGEEVRMAREAIGRRHSWAPRVPTGPAGPCIQWRCEDCQAVCDVKAGLEGPVYGCGPREAGQPAPTPVGSAWVITEEGICWGTDEGPEEPPRAEAEGYVAEGRSEGGPPSPELLGIRCDEPAVATPPPPGPFPPPVDLEAHRLPQADLAPPDLDHGAALEPQATPSQPLSFEDGRPPVATSSSLGTDCGVVLP